MVEDRTQRRPTQSLTIRVCADVVTLLPPYHAELAHFAFLCLQRDFLLNYRLASGELVHERIIDEMTTANGCSLHVSYVHLSQHAPILAIWLADVPKAMLALFGEVAKAVVFARSPDYWNIAPEIYVRVTQLPIADSLRELRHVHLNAFVKVSGVITRRTGVFPQLKVVYYNCNRCGAIQGPVHINEAGEAYRGSCSDCQSKGPWTVNSEQTVFRNYQKMTLQEAPGSVPPGRVPRYKDVILVGDLIDSARPGEEVEVTGIYTHTFDAGLNSRQGFPVFATVLEANYVEVKNDMSSALVLTDADRAEIAKLSRDPRIIQRIVRSIAPSIYGHETVKLAIAMAMFGGREKNINAKHRIRGDINVLLLGDPGVAKSQFLKYVEKTAPRAVYTTGKGASAVGLTAAVHKDPLTGEWTLEGGALVLADRGVCLIDEFDKMNDADRTSIHEVRMGACFACYAPNPIRLALLRRLCPNKNAWATASDCYFSPSHLLQAMEQQSISISKAGIVTTLQARCSVIAAANPIGGRYDVSKTFSENVALTDPILTRFDVLCVMRDEVDGALDERLATFVTDSHTLSHPMVQGTYRKMAAEGLGESAAKSAALAHHKLSVSSLDLLGGPAAIAAAASAGVAVGGAGAAALAAAGAATAGVAGSTDGLEPIPQALLKKYILQARATRPQLAGIDADKVSRLYAELRKESEVSGGIPIAVRHIESILRMSEAAARMRLSAFVSNDDLDLAIRVMLESFIGAQKFTVTKSLRRHFSRYLTAGADHNQLLLLRLKELVRERVSLEVIRSGRFGHGLELPDDADSVEIRAGDLEQRARRHGVDPSRVYAFFSSTAFRDAGFTFDSTRKMIIRDVR